MYWIFLLLAYGPYFLIQQQVSYFVQSPIILALGCLILPTLILLGLESWRPLHKAWQPKISELFHDFFYMFFIQLGVPALFLILGPKFSNSLWPTQWPLLIQLALMMIVGEFLQYWWHRLCHAYPFLWPIHAIHHTPQKLYSINTVRFHFLDKAGDFLINIYIFVILGAGPELVSIYYIFFAITGFVQHCNFDIRLGFMDYVIASGETHRYHHDVNPHLAKCNYANNIVLWDLVYGTFKKEKLPAKSEVGMRGPSAPRTLIEESFYPFKIWSQKNYLEYFEFRFFKFLLNLLMPLKMQLHNRSLYNQLLKSLNEPEKAQEKVLRKIINQNQQTLFGQDHGFSQIKSTSDFARQVPISDFEFHRPYVNRILDFQQNVLTQDPVTFLAKTSGTSGLPKYIPVTEEVERQYMVDHEILAYSLYKKNPKSLTGLIFSAVGPAIEELLSEKFEAGSLSGKLFSKTPRILRRKHAVQEEVSTLQDQDLKYLVLATLALLTPETSLYISPNPSSLLRILKVLNNQRITLVEILDKKGFAHLIQNKKDELSFANYKLPRLSYHQARARRILALKRQIEISDLWPDLVNLVCWMGGSCSFLIPRLKESAKTQVEFIELGYLSSEFRGTVNVGIQTQDLAPTLLDNYFEFIEKNLYENGSRKTIELQSLVPGEEYYIFVTTTSGLYRYFINDIVKAGALIGATPSLTFVQKGKGVTNITGEKLSEQQVVAFMSHPSRQALKASFFICLAEVESQSYVLWIETETAFNSLQLQEDLDVHLSLMNIEYESKLKSQRLNPAQVKKLKQGAGEAYRDFCLSQGQRESQFKYLHLQYGHENKFPFDDYVEKT